MKQEIWAKNRCNNFPLLSKFQCLRRGSPYVNARIIRSSITEKKAMQVLYKLEQTIISLVKLNRQIVALTNDFDAYWREKR